MGPRNFHESFSSGPVKPPSARGTGFVFAAVAVIVALLWRNTPLIAVPFLTLACVLGLISVWAPQALEPLNRIWFRFGLLLHRVVHPVVLFVLFALVFVPAGLIMRLFYDPLRLRREKQSETYWIDCTADETPKPSMRNQF